MLRLRFYMFGVWKYEKDIKRSISVLKVTRKLLIIMKCFAESSHVCIFSWMTVNWFASASMKNGNIVSAKGQKPWTKTVVKCFLIRTLYLTFILIRNKIHGFTLCTCPLILLQKYFIFNEWEINLWILPTITLHCQQTATMM